jgi:hypothetical protein
MMPTLAELRNTVEQILGLPGIPATLQLNSPTRERAFEGYVFSLLVRAVRQASGTATLVGRNSGPNPAVVVFRGGPGLLGSAAQDFAYAECQLGAKEFELHLDVQYEGNSQAIHEVDVSIYDRDAADRIRSNPAVFAKTNKLHGAIECKFYDTTLGTTLGRTFVGLVDDCGGLELKVFATNGLSQGLVRYFTPKKRPNRFFRLSPLRPDKQTAFVEFAKQVLGKWAGIA